MTEHTNSEGVATAPPPQHRPPLVRPVSPRVIAGVASGLSRTTGIGAGWFRAAFIITAFAGGLGFAAYAAFWAMVRAEDQAEAPAERLVENIRNGESWIGVALLVVAGVIVLSEVTILSGTVLWATVLATIGILLYRKDLTIGSATTQAHSANTTAVEPDENAPVGPTIAPTAPALASSASGTVVAEPVAPRPPAPPRPRSILGRVTIGVALLAIGLLAVVDNVTATLNPEPRHYLALGTLVIGLGLLVGAFAGRARWLILIGVLALPPLLASPLAEVDWSSDLDRVIRPATAAAADGDYELAAGSYRFDLTDTEWNGETINLSVDMAAGEIVVVLPEGVGLEGSAEVNFGELDTPGDTQAGIGELRRNFDTAGDLGTVNLDLELGFGSIQVRYESIDGGNQ